MRLGFFCLFLLGCFTCITPTLSAQKKVVDAIDIYRHAPSVKKGRISFVWGWNRSTYTKSDTRFFGNGYDFTIQDMKATDRQTPFGLDPYFHPLYVTIPQTNMQIRYNFKDLWSIGVNVDHMKYVMVQNQEAIVNGVIGGHGPHAGKYDNTITKLSPSLLTYEHTDGLNYINAELVRYITLLNPQSGKYKELSLHATAGASIGALLPKTNAKLLENKRHDDFHWAGYGGGIKAGVHIGWKRFFIETEAEAGYINMPNIRTTGNKDDKASQHFGFLQTALLFGMTFGIGS